MELAASLHLAPKLSPRIRRPGPAHGVAFTSPPVHGLAIACSPHHFVTGSLRDRPNEVSLKIKRGFRTIRIHR